MRIEIRQAAFSDLSDIKALFVNSIRNSCSKDYSPIEIDAWCEGANNIERWEESLKGQYFIVACSGVEILGFASLKITPFERKGYLDFLYVHAEHQNTGIAKELVQKIELEASERKIETIDSDVSITALPFFKKQGFDKVRRNFNRKGKGVDLVNYRMTKDL